MKSLEASPKAPKARPSIPESKEVSEATEIFLDGQKYLLEKGDRVRIVTEEAVQVTADDAYMAVDEFIQVVHPAWLKAFRRLDEMGLVKLPTDPDFRQPVDEAEYPPAAGLTKELMDQMEDAMATAKDLLEAIRVMP